MEWKVPLVIHTDFGGFGLTSLMHERLLERKVPWLERCQKTAGNRWYLPYEDDDELRRDPDLVDVVRQLEVELAAASSDMGNWAERRELERAYLHGLKVVEVTVVLEINDHDGKETVRVTGGTW